MVPSLHTNFILGLDWLKENRVKVDFGSREISIDPRRKLIAGYTVTIPPQSEAVLVARIQGQKLPPGVLGITSGSDDLIMIGLVTAGVLDSVSSDNTVMCRVVNPKKHQVIVNKRQHLGKFVCLSSQGNLTSLGFDTGNLQVSSIEAEKKKTS